MYKFTLLALAMGLALQYGAPARVTHAQTSTPLSPTYLYPRPASRNVSAGATIAVRFPAAVQPDALDAQQFRISGTRSGRLSGKVTLAEDGRTMLFIPRRPFAPGETVSVTIASDMPTIDAAPTAAQAFTFTVSSKKYPYVTPAPRAAAAAMPQDAVRPYLTAPATVPVFTTTLGAQPPSAGNIFLATFFTPFPYLLIYDASGALVWQRAMKPGRQYADFKTQPDGRLSYFDGVGTTYGGHGTFYVMNSSYEVIDRWNAGHGYETDNHELLLLPNGGAVLMVYDLQTVDMTPWGGKPNATVIETVIQELDRARNVVFEWRASDHIAYDEAYEPLDGDLVDPTHGNSVDVLSNGDFLVSFRHTSQVLRISRETGEIVWRMGGRRNEFSFTNDPGFSYQHDARMLPDGRLSIFDNGNQHNPPRSRAVEYVVDEHARTATRAWEYAHSPTIYNFFMGNADRLTNGNTFIGWGGPRTIATEVTSDGQKALEMELVGQGFVYRWHKEPWRGAPKTTPKLVLNRTAVPALHFSWNGATEIAAWRIEAGAGVASLTEVATVQKSGFETSLPLEGALADGRVFRVTALDAAGNALSSSNIVRR